MLCDHVCVWTTYDGVGFRTQLWIHEPSRGHYPIVIPVLTTLVREYIWAGPSKLFHARFACRACSYRSVVRYRPLYINLHRITYAVWSLSVAACRVCYHRSTVHEPCIPKAHAILCRLYLVAVVGDHVPFASLRCRSHRR